MNWKECRRKRPWLNLRLYAGKAEENHEKPQISGSLGDEYEDGCLLGYCAM
jgi:hypothetical protein